MAGTTEQKLIENEAKFRSFNEAVKRGFDNLELLAREQDWREDVSGPDGKLQFFCECSDENCAERVPLTMHEYTAIHKDRECFVVVPGHEALKVESVVLKGNGYTIVKKVKMPPENVDHLHKTDIKNV